MRNLFFAGGALWARAGYGGIFLLLILPLAVTDLAAQPSPITDAFTVNDTTAGSQLRPAVASADGGDFVVAWETYESSVSRRAFDSVGGSASSEVVVGAASMSLPATTAIAANAGGEFVIVWTRSEMGEESIRVQRFNSSGTAVASEMQANIGTELSRGEPAVAMTDSGLALVTWQDFGTGSGDSEILGRLFVSSGMVVGGEMMINANTIGDQLSPTVDDFDGQDRFVVAWHGPDGTLDIFTRLVDSVGMPLGAGDSTVNTTFTGVQIDADVAASGENFAVVWSSDFSTDGDLDGQSVHARLYESTGVAVGDQFQVNIYTTGEQHQPAVAMDDCNDYVVVWLDQRPGGGGEVWLGDPTLITGRRFNGRGTCSESLGPCCLDGSDTEIFTATSSGLPAEPDISSAANGDFVVVWQAGSPDVADIFGRVFDLDGAPIFSDGFETGDTSSWSDTNR